MLVDRYETEDVFARVPRMAQRIDPVLKHLDRLLEDDELYQQIRADFGHRFRFTLVHGRHSTPVEVLLRMLILKHLYQWSYQETEEQVDQKLILRWFCRLYWARCPMTPHCCAGPIPYNPKPCMPSMIAWCSWRGRRK